MLERRCLGIPFVALSLTLYYEHCHAMSRYSRILVIAGDRRFSE